MLISHDKQFLQAPFGSEEELEQVVSENADYLFGPGSIYLPKRLIHTRDNFGTIPDGFVIDIPNRQWFVVEVELSAHNVWGHIAPQIAKQIIAATRPETKQLLTELLISAVRDDESMMEKFTDEDIDRLDVRGVLIEIFNKDPIIGIPIDSISNDLRAWAETLKVDVKLWTVKKHVEFQDSSSVLYEIPEEYQPDFDTREKTSTTRAGIARYDVTVLNLINANLVAEGEKLFMSYKPRAGERKNYTATVQANGFLELCDKAFASPSYAALYGIQAAGSNRRTVNGWTSWKNSEGKTLADLREQYLSNQENERSD